MGSGRAGKERSRGSSRGRLVLNRPPPSAPCLLSLAYPVRPASQACAYVNPSRLLSGVLGCCTGVVSTARAGCCGGP